MSQFVEGNQTITVKIPIDYELRKAIAAWLDSHQEPIRRATDKEIREYVLAIWEADNDDTLSQFYAYEEKLKWQLRSALSE